MASRRCLPAQRLLRPGRLRLSPEGAWVSPSKIRGCLEPIGPTLVVYSSYWLRPVRTSRFNSEFAHLINQGGAREAASRGGPSLAPDQPIGLLQYFQYVVALRIGKRARDLSRRLFFHLLRIILR